MTLQHPTFKGQLVLIGDEVTVRHDVTEEHDAIVTALWHDDRTVWARVQFKRKPARCPKQLLVYVDSRQARFPEMPGWCNAIVAHTPRQARFNETCAQLAVRGD